MNSEIYKVYSKQQKNAFVESLKAEANADADVNNEELEAEMEEPKDSVRNFKNEFNKEIGRKLLATLKELSEDYNPLSRQAYEIQKWVTLIENFDGLNNALGDDGK